MLLADDIVICEETREEVEQSLECWRYALERRGMEVNRSKTECVCINGGNDDETVKLEDTKVPRVKKFKLLGVICDRRLPARVKGKVYTTVVRPAMVYGFETVEVTKKQVEEMEVAEMRMFRFAMGVRRKD